MYGKALTQTLEVERIFIPEHPEVLTINILKPKLPIGQLVNKPIFGDSKTLGCEVLGLLTVWDLELDFMHNVILLIISNSEELSSKLKYTYEALTHQTEYCNIVIKVPHHHIRSPSFIICPMIIYHVKALDTYCKTTLQSLSRRKRSGLREHKVRIRSTRRTMIGVISRSASDCSVKAALRRR